MSPMTKPRGRISKLPPGMPPVPRRRTATISWQDGFYITRDGTDARVVCVYGCKHAIFHCQDDPAAIAEVKEAHQHVERRSL